CGGEVFAEERGVILRGNRLIASQKAYLIKAMWSLDASCLAKGISLKCDVKFEHLLHRKWLYSVNLMQNLEFFHIAYAHIL
ncbi:MAG: hypothetical protein J6R94_00940, partial [Agathobacter sp.]|nr:hypothetical protein [Agathobacter sp.]